ncbi:MAG: hypothetical protein CL477_16130 [Acidobacteria bacterium]|jgi:antitoxin (DNA-binding transcriptional repressor) of toxin-antitoxin stability system|nr:hypothetical protein [Acidobacteriota bacterium]MDP7339784.1 type II toxin-antitoxin system Phd/YefM family antitoxin [Vicinamibacterales bacterium]MDP7478116.1 type II toxin-antitoxin system Phd/YefM family antitoxin [Vicinamibacterales bacterium]MDP7691120.1 type II toxin-antitoxin system Phd/YefM family antitoxin [Vicinamibacterales bacterium]HJN44087.1 type II toxin-antitoxin system Phd/YefM family antitoxin [Vicinamibacterales bacterium]|tara:strand:- start:82 stop:384 length:303 start_codon:yes stop_codon:yes gene_type:complete
MTQRKPASGNREERVVTATYAAKNFGALVDRVREEGATYVVERGGAPVAEIRPAQRPFTGRDLLALIESGPRADEEYLRAVEEGIALMNRDEEPVNRWET